MKNYSVTYIAHFLIRRLDGSTAAIRQIEVEADSIKEAIDAVEDRYGSPYLKVEIIEVKLI